MAMSIWSRGLGVLVDCDDRRGVERRKRLSGNPVGGHPALAESLVAAAHLLDRHTGAFGDLDTGAAGGWGEPSCRPRSRRSGVNRQSSSRPCGTSKASTSNDVNSSPLLSAEPFDGRWSIPLFLPSLRSP